MKCEILGIMLILVTTACPGQAQSSDYSKGQAVFSIAPGGRVAGHDEWNRPTMQAGFAGEGFFRRHWGVGADLAYLRSPAADRVAARNWFILSPRVVARFPVQSDKTQVEPFVTGGYSLINRQHSPNGVVSGETPIPWWETEHGMNLGGGVSLWFSKNVGLRLELRDCVRRPFAHYGDHDHLVSAHIGVTIR
jgi:hypothetical protein